MAERRLGTVLQGLLYVGAALLLHGALFLVPWGRPTRTEAPVVRGMRVRTFSAVPAASPPVPAAPVYSERPRVEPSRTVAPGAAVAPPSPGGAIEGGSRPGGAGEGGAASGAGPGGGSPRGTSPDAYSEYLARLRTREIQGWARDRSRESQKGWRGSGAGGASEGWGAGGGGGSGNGKGTGSGAAGYLDPRVQMVVSSYPPTSIETRHTVVRYPEIKFRKEQYASGWWNVYFQVWTDEGGRIRRIAKLRPETDGPLERLFVEQVRREIERWAFDPVAAEIIVDVRFHVE